MAKSFRMRDDAENWFSNIKNKKTVIKTKFDRYYYCLMIGLASGHYSEPTQRCKDCTDFVDDFVKEYQAQQKLIIGLLVRAELADSRISLNDKEETRKLLLDLIDPTSQTNLTDYGMDRMNAYSSGGYDYLSEHLDSKPHYVEDFLITYVKLLKEAVDNNPKWQPATVQGTEILEQI
jgi:hypothetical protein